MRTRRDASKRIRSLLGRGQTLQCQHSLHMSPLSSRVSPFYSTLVLFGKNARHGPSKELRKPKIEKENALNTSADVRTEDSQSPLEDFRPWRADDLLGRIAGMPRERCVLRVGLDSGPLVSPAWRR